MKLSIREFTEGDIAYILELLYELDRPKPLDDDDLKVFKNKIENYLLDPKKAIFVAEQEEKIVGLVSIIYLQRLNHAKLEMYIPELVVTEKIRYSGIGKKLIQYCIDLAKKKNCFRIRLESGNQRKDSHQFYKRIGFEQSGLSFSKSII